MTSRGIRRASLPLFAMAASAALSQPTYARNGCEPGWFFDGNGCRPMFYQGYASAYEESQHHGWDVMPGRSTSGENGIWIQPWNGDCPWGFAFDRKVRACVDRRW